MKLINDLNAAKQEIYDHVGFVEDWVFYPIVDRTDMIWQINADEVKYANTDEQFDSDGDYYSDEIYKQRFYSKHVYAGAKITMIFCDTHTDGMKVFAIFDNAKRRM